MVPLCPFLGVREGHVLPDMVAAHVQFFVLPRDMPPGCGEGWT